MWGKRSSYTLIFLINLACKILAKMSTKVLLSTFPKLICPNQVGFIKTRLPNNNISF